MTKAKAKPTPAVPVSQLSKRRATTVAGVAIPKASATKAKEVRRPVETDKAQLFDIQALDIKALATEVARQISGNVSAGVGTLSNSSDFSNGPSAGSASAKQTALIGSSLKVAKPVDSEIDLISSNLDEVHSLISELTNELESHLAHEEDCVDKACEGRPSRSSESPLHRRLIDRNETLDNVISRLRYLKARIRN